MTHKWQPSDCPGSPNFDGGFAWEEYQRDQERRRGNPLIPHDPDFRVVPVRILQGAYDCIDAMLAGIEPDLRAANSVRIELRHLINESYALTGKSRATSQPNTGDLEK